MADFSKLSKKRLGAPPPIEEASETLQAPETAPASIPRPSRPLREDGRSMRRTGRTIQFATRVTERFDRDVRQIAKAEGMLLAEVLEKAIECYKAHLAARKQRAGS